MPWVEKPLWQGLLPAAAAVQYTPDAIPTNGMAKLMCLTIANNDTVARTFSLYRGTSAALATVIVPTMSIPAGAMWCLTPLGILIPTGSSIWGVASVAGLITVTGDGGVWLS